MSMQKLEILSFVIFQEIQIHDSTNNKQNTAQECSQKHYF